MKRAQKPRPTDAELAILNVLWRLGSATVREVHERLNLRKPTGYTTTLKLMQIMAEKGLLTRDESQRAHLYSPGFPRERTLRGLAKDLMERAFEGSAEKLMVHALQARKVKAAEIARIREMLDAYERGHNERDTESSG